MNQNLPEWSSHIAGIGVALPALRLPIETLAEQRNVDPDKYTIGLGCIAQSLCPTQGNHCNLGIHAAQNALKQWGGSLEDIGLLAVGTECALDMARPLSAWISEALQLPPNIRSYEVKHACYAGTLAIRQALEWQCSGASRGKAALVVCADEALYAPGHPGEPTQGAAAVALVLAPNGFATIGLHSYAFQRPAFDFWRPIGDAYPQVDGPLSIQCYQDAFASCLQQWKQDEDALFPIDDVDRWAMHAPFPKMVQKGYTAAHKELNMSPKEALNAYQHTILPSLAWNRRTGNCYTASTWLSFAHSVGHATHPQHIALFSYGSGCGAELLLCHQHATIDEQFVASVEAQFDAQHILDLEGYVELRRHK